jgi:hypothetical protein
MTTPSWHSDLETGLGALIAALEAAESGATGLGKAPNWDEIKAKAASIKAHAATALHEFSQQSGKLQNAAKYIERLQEQIGQFKQQAAQQQPMQGPQAGTGTGMPPRPGMGQAGNQTVYLSAGATAGIAAGALLIGAVGGFATKAIIDSGKEKKKLAAAEEAKKKALKTADSGSEEEEEEEEEQPRKGGKR